MTSYRGWSENFLGVKAPQGADFWGILRFEDSGQGNDPPLSFQPKSSEGGGHSLGYVLIRGAQARKISWEIVNWVRTPFYILKLPTLPCIGNFRG